MPWVWRPVLTLALVWTGLMVPTSAHAVATTCPVTSPTLVNGGFEDPVVTPGFPRRLPLEDFPGWGFTEPIVEVWPPGVTEGPPGGTGPYVAAEGDQFIELNATRPDGLFQVFETSPGQVLLVEAFHRGRSGPNTAAMFLGTAGLPIDRREDMTDSPDQWGRYDWSYRVPSAQTETRLAFVAVTGSGPDDSIGNFLDGVSVAGAGCLEVSKQAADLTRPGRPQVGDVVAFTVRVENTGGHSIRAPVIADHAPPWTAYVPGSLRILTGPDRGPQSDADDGDRAHASSDGAVRFDVGTGAGDELAPGQSVSVAFRVRIASTAGGRTVVNEASAGYSLLDLADAVILTRQAALSNAVRIGPVRPPTPAPSPSPSSSPSSSASPASSATSPSYPSGQALAAPAAGTGDLGPTGAPPFLGGLFVLGLGAVAAGAWLVTRGSRDRTGATTPALRPRRRRGRGGGLSGGAVGP